LLTNKITNKRLPSESLLMQALDHFHAKRLAQARDVCEQALALESDSSDFLMLLGSIAVSESNFPLACDYYLQVASVDPDSMLGKLAMGFYLRHTGKPHEAVACFRQATILAPDDPTSWALLAETLNGLGRSVEAQECAKRVQQINTRSMRPPTNQSKHASSRKSPTKQSRVKSTDVKSLSLDEIMFFAQSLYKQGRFAEALDAYWQALALRVAFVPALYGVGLCQMHLNNDEEAISSLKQVLEQVPDHALALHEMVQALIKRRRPEDAETYARKLVQLTPRIAQAHIDLGIVLTYQFRLQEAAICYQRALELNPQDASIYNNLGTVALLTGDMEDAALYCSRALELQPNFPDAAANLGFVLLLQGDFDRGWMYHEARLHSANFTALRTPYPFWDGSSIAGKTILVRAEQGIGDTIHFIRYLPLLKARGAHIKFIGPPVLRDLLTSLGCIDEWLNVQQEQPVVGVDLYAPLLSLPFRFGTRLETIPAHVPYIAPSLQLRERWRERLASYPGYRVGIVWAGNPDFTRDRERSCPLHHFLPLFGIPGISLFSLQKGERATAQIAELPEDKRPIDLGGELHTLDDTAAAIINLDLVISVDTSVAHLAGALAHPVWTLLPHSPDWRWLLNRSDSPWYPTMRLFRQPAQHDWESVFRDVAGALIAR
jgi:tetratricopeptide (TPR) repeat protein